MKCLIPIFPIVLLAAGCTTLQAQQRRDAEVRLRTEVATAKQRTQTLEQRVEALEAVREMTFQRLDELRATVDALAALSDRRDGDLALRVDRERADREKMRTELVQALSEKMAEIIKTQAPARQPPRGGGGSGYEHTVKSGETLSEIARAYNVRMDAILRANKLATPDSLKVGQTLFIPD